MRLQKATQFALYSVLELALEPARQLSAGEIAEKCGISNNHLAKVLRDLGRGGLVESTRGVDGFGITVSYWESEEAIAAWRRQVDHAAVRAHGREHWYERYELRVAKVERAYGMNRKSPKKPA